MTLIEILEALDEDGLIEDLCALFSCCGLCPPDCKGCPLWGPKEFSEAVKELKEKNETRN